MDRYGTSLQSLSDSEIDFLANQWAFLETSVISELFEGIRFSSRILSFPLRDQQVGSARQIRSLLFRIKAIENEIVQKQSDKIIGKSDRIICDKNLESYERSTNARNEYISKKLKKRFHKDAEIKKYKFLCDAYVMNHFAFDLGYKCALLTITLPREMQIVSLDRDLSGVKSTNECIHFLNSTYKKFTKKIPSDELVFGIKVIELDTKGVPHAHVILFYAPSSEKSICRLFKSTMKDSGAGFSHFAKAKENFSINGNKAISYCAGDLDDTVTNAVLSRHNGTSCRQHQAFGLKLHTTLFDKIITNIQSLKNQKGFLGEIYKTLTSDLKTSEKKYIFIKDIYPNIKPIKCRMVSIYGNERFDIIGIKCIDTGLEATWTCSNELDQKQSTENKNQNHESEFCAQKKEEDKIVNVKLSSIETLNLISQQMLSAILIPLKNTNRRPCTLSQCLKEKREHWQWIFPGHETPYNRSLSQPGRIQYHLDIRVRGPPETIAG